MEIAPPTPIDKDAKIKLFGIEAPLVSSTFELKHKLTDPQVK